MTLGAGSQLCWRSEQRLAVSSDVHFGVQVLRGMCQGCTATALAVCSRLMQDIARHTAVCTVCVNSEVLFQAHCADCVVQERLLLSLLPRFVALEIIADIAKEEDHRKLLSGQFHKIYIHCYDDVRYVQHRRPPLAPLTSQSVSSPQHHLRRHLRLHGPGFALLTTTAG